MKGKLEFNEQLKDLKFMQWQSILVSDILFCDLIIFTNAFSLMSSNKPIQSFNAGRTSLTKPTLQRMLTYRKNLPWHISGWCLLFCLMHSPVHVLHEVVVVNSATFDVWIKTLQRVIEEIHQHGFASTHSSPKVNSLWNLSLSTASPSKKTQT